MIKIEKPWGFEELLENDRYVVKRLFMKKDCSCSLQYHAKKKETIYVLGGVLIITIGETIDGVVTLVKKECLPGTVITIEPGIIHRMSGQTDSFYLECSTTELDDVVRLEDFYGRK